MNKKIRRILRDFFNESTNEVYKQMFVPHAGNDDNCRLCQIEKQAINKMVKLIENLTKHNRNIMFNKFSGANEKNEKNNIIDCWINGFS